MKKITLILLTLLNMSCQSQQKNDMKDYEKAVDTIINKVIALKAKHPKQLRTIDRELKGELIDFNPYFHKEISENNFWAKFHYERGKYIIDPISSKLDTSIVQFYENGVSINIYFIKGNWNGDREGRVISFGALNIVVFIGNDKNGLYKEIENIIQIEKNKLNKNDLDENSHDNIINRDEAILIAKKDANEFLGTWVECAIKNKNWHISASSKSANPPKYYVIDSENGKILLRLDNTDHPKQQEKLKTYLKKAQKKTKEDYKQAIILAENLMAKEGHILKKYNLVKLRHKALYGRNNKGGSTTVWEVVFKVKRTDGEDVYMIKGGEIFIEVDISKKTAKVTGWGE